tara:strand:- start:81 stop:488 length:408 start_codon:yes stop_codon:yes gene_type:complete
MSKKKIIENIKDMKMDILDKLDLHITINGGLTAKELVKTIDFYSFTPESLEYMFNQINTYKNTFHGIGPFLFRDGGWHNIRERKLDVIKRLTEENIKLKKKNLDKDAIVNMLKIKVEELKEILESREEFIKDHCA